MQHLAPFREATERLGGGATIALERSNSYLLLSLLHNIKLLEKFIESKQRTSCCPCRSVQWAHHRSARSEQDQLQSVL